MRWEILSSSLVSCFHFSYWQLHTHFYQTTVSLFSSGSHSFLPHLSLHLQYSPLSISLSFFSTPHCRCLLFHTSPFTLSVPRCRHILILQNVFFFFFSFIFCEITFFFLLFFSEYISTPWPSFIFKREAQRQSCLWLVDVRRWMVVSPLGHGSEFGEP